ncbi:MAG: FAD-dependent oxidoreductase [Alphaproteobacteria bacterium]
MALPYPVTGIPVACEADVVVVGAGPGGFAAALQAARMGRSVVVVERFDMPGGVHTSGLQGAANTGVGGIHSELMLALDDRGYIYNATQDTHPGWAGNPLSHYERRLPPDAGFARASFNPEGAGAVMAGMLQDVGVTALYGASFVDAVVDRDAGKDGRITAIVVETASGRLAIAGRVFIEGSGTAALAAAAGVPYMRGGGGQPKTADWDGIERPIPGGLLWIMANVDFAATQRHQRDANDPDLSKLIAEADAAGDIPPGLYRSRMGGSGVYGEAYIGHPTLDMSPIMADGTYIVWQNVPYEWALHMDDDADDEARAKRELRCFVDAEASFLRKYVPGFENAYLANVGRFVGIRDGRHPLGEHVFSLDDARAGTIFPDAVTAPMRKPFYWDRHERHSFTVPYRSFLPLGIDNLLLTGASLSFTYDTIFMVMRNFPWCTQTGEIAGYAAARALDTGVTPKALDWTEPYFP